MTTGSATMAIAADGLWLADHDDGVIQRLDPSTGEVELTASAPAPAGFSFLGDRM
jgi:streptogramin lyase